MRGLLWALVGLAIGGAVGWYALREANLDDTVHAIAGLNPRMIVLAMGAVVFAGLIEAIRWKFLLPKQRVSIVRLFFIRHTAMGLNNVSPLRYIGDITQGAMLKFGDGVHTDKVVSSLLIARMFDALVTISLVGAGLVVLPQLAGFRDFVMPLWALVVGSTLLAIFLAANPRIVARIPRPHFLNPTIDSLSAVMVDMGVVFGCMLLTATAWMSIATAAWLVGLAAGLNLPFWLMAIVIIGVSVFSGMVPAPPGAIGVYEFAVISTLSLFAIDPTKALAFALAVHGVLFIPPILIAIVVLAVDRKTFRHVAGATRGVLHRRHGDVPSVG